MDAVTFWVGVVGPHFHFVVAGGFEAALYAYVRATLAGFPAGVLVVSLQAFSDASRGRRERAVRRPPTC